MAKETIKTMHERDISAERTRSRAVGIIAKAFCYAFLIFMALVVLFPVLLDDKFISQKP